MLFFMIVRRDLYNGVLIIKIVIKIRNFLVRFFVAIFEPCDMWLMKYCIEYAIFFITLPRELTHTQRSQIHYEKAF